MSRSGTRSVLRVVMLTLNAVAAAGVLAAYLAGIVSPATFWPLAFAGLAYPILLLIIILFALFWGIKGDWKLLLAHILLIALRFDLLADYYQFPSEKKTQDTEAINVMSYNVRLFDFYNWSGQEDARTQMLQSISTAEPDILCLQEYYTKSKNPKRKTPIKVTFPSTGYKHVENYADHPEGDFAWGLATFSAYPILDHGRIAFDNTSGNLCIFTDVLLQSDTVRIYNLHLQSARIGSKEWGALNHLIEHGKVDSLHYWLTIFSRLKTAFVARAEQVNIVAAHIATCQYPVILCGDFNDTYASHSYQQISSGLTDAFHESGTGFGFTYAKFPFFRIDNILYGPAFHSSQHEVLQWPWSDHYAVAATLHRD